MKVVLGTVKVGRNQLVKYPGGEGAPLPSDEGVQALIECARSLKVSWLDTAPAYGISEERLGKVLSGYSRDSYFISTKVGEIFEKGVSSYDFNLDTVLASINQSLDRLKTNYLDLLWLHLPRADLNVLQELDRNGKVKKALQELKVRGVVKKIGASTSSIEGGVFAASLPYIETLMVSYNIEYQAEWPAIAAAAAAGKGVWIKKGLLSGHLKAGCGVKECISFLSSKKEISAVVVGTTQPKHLVEIVNLVNSN